MAEHLPCIPEPAGWVRHLQREHAEVAYPVPHCRKDRQNWPCDTIKALEMAAAAERERIAALADECHAMYTHARGPNVPGFRRAFSALVRTTTEGNPS